MVLMIGGKGHARMACGRHRTLPVGIVQTFPKPSLVPGPRPSDRAAFRGLPARQATPKTRITAIVRLL